MQENECLRSAMTCKKCKITDVDKVDWSGKNADFSTVIGCHGNVPWKIKKAQWCYQALSPVYQSWNFGEDRSIGFWASGAPGATTKKI